MFGFICPFSPLPVYLLKLKPVESGTALVVFIQINGYLESCSVWCCCIILCYNEINFSDILRNVLSTPFISVMVD